ncbi:arginine--tRNA ligase [Patescibacteria group bacterium]
MARQKIINLIEKSIKEAQKKKNLAKFKIPEIKIECPEERAYGDYATNTAMVVSKQSKKNPMEIANILSSELKDSGANFFEKIEVVKPGFINFFLSKEYLQKKVGEILKEKEKFGQLKFGRGKKINIEFISANPTGSLHLGNGRGAFFGDALSNVLEKAGFTITREYYVNDAKTNSQIKTLGKTALGRGITYLTPCLESKISSLKNKLKEIKDEQEAGFLLAKLVQKDIKDFIEKKLKIKFNNWVSEQDFYEKNKVDKIYNFLKKKNLIYKKEGAEWVKTSNFGDEKNRVAIRETGQATYLLSDIAYHKDKFDRGFQKIINIWGADHQGHVLKMKAVKKILGFKGDLEILICQMVRLKKGKISKRKGEIITLEWLIDEVGLDAARFFYLMKSLKTQMEFDVQLAKERSEKSPVFYVQYAHARICSILRKLKMKDKKLKTETKNLKLLNHQSELKLIKELNKFPEIIEDTAKDYQIQRLPQYAVNLAACFHQFYRNCRVLTKDKNLKEVRLSLALATKTVLKNTLDLMGVAAPEKM